MLMPHICINTAFIISFKKIYLKMLSVKMVAILFRGRWVNSLQQSTCCMIYMYIDLTHWSLMMSYAIMDPGPWFNIKTSSHQYRNSHCGDKTVIRSSYLHNGISYTDKMASLYWIAPLVMVGLGTIWTNADLSSIKPSREHTFRKFHS